MSTIVGGAAMARDEEAGKQQQTVVLSQFAHEALAGGDAAVSAAVQLESALRCYVRDRGTDRPAWAYPDFLRDSETQGDVRIEVEVAGELWRAFVAEADRQQISSGQLAEHAAFYFAAEMNAGRLTERILEDLGTTDAAES
jgi:hypothetical protein